MTSGTTVGYPALAFALILGIAIGAALGWLAKSSRERATAQSDQQQTAEIISSALRIERAESNATTQHTVSTVVDRTLQPVQQALNQLAQQVTRLEIERARAGEQLATQVDHVARTNLHLADTTQRLAQALASPSARGRWGEMQLSRIVELAGMNEHCDFSSQYTVRGDDGALRPDMVVHLAGDKHIVLDAKAPLSAYIDATEAVDEQEHAALLKRHAWHLKQHISTLAKRNYPAHIPGCLEETILFLPAEPILQAACQADPMIIDYTTEHHIVLATPTTLITLLRTVALGWRQEALTDRARDIQHLGAELYRRLGTINTHLATLGNQLNKTVETYNTTVASLETRLTTTARKLHDLGVTPARSNAPSALQAIPNRTRSVANGMDNTPESFDET